MENQFIFISGQEELLVSLAQIAFVLVQREVLVLHLSGGQQIQVTGTGAAELRAMLKERTIMTTGVPMPANFVL